MIVRKEYIKYMDDGFSIWRIVKYLLFGFIPLYVKKTKLK